jgi:AGZA family xanthine/uracil permease-like MFS transporter
MGLNAYFTFQVVGWHGTGSISYRLALTAVFIEGFVFVFLSLIGMRQWLVKIIPGSVKVASGVGIGLFLTEIGLSYSGIGLITGSSVTPTALGGCPSQYLGADGSCTSHKMTSPTVSSACTFMDLLTIIVVDRHYLWRFLNRVSYVISCKICHNYWYRGGFYHIMAVSSSQIHIIETP